MIENRAKSAEGECDVRMVVWKFDILGFHVLVKGQVILSGTFVNTSYRKVEEKFLFLFKELDIFVFHNF
jgi:hypothetical protein